MSTFLEQRQQIEQSYQAQLAQLSQQQATAETSLQEQARQQASSVETQKQQVLVELYKQEELSQRQRALGQPFVPTTEVRAGVEQKAANLQESTQAELEKALKSIKEQVETGKAELSKWKQGSLTSVKKAESEFKATNVELNTGEWVPKDKFETYDTSHQQMLLTMGVDKFNAAVEKEQKDFEAANVLLTTGEWTLKEKYDKLSPTDQQLLNQLGIDKFNATKGQEGEDFKAIHIEVKPDVWYVTSEWKALTPTQQQQLLTTGLYTTTPATGEEALQQLKDAGKVPKTATLKSYDPVTGTVQYTTPPVELTGEDWKKLFFQQPSNIQQSYIFRQAPYLGARSWSQLSVKEQEQVLKDFSKEYSYLGQILSLPKEAQVELAKNMLKSTATVAALMGATVLVAKVPMPALVETVLADTINAAWIGLGTYGLTNTIKTVLPDPSIPTWQKSLDITLNVAAIAAGVYGIGAVGRIPTLPSVVKAAANDAGAAAKELQAAMKAASAYKSSALLPSDVANRLQLAQANVISADTKFAASLNELRLTSKQIALLEKLSGYKGLEPLISDVGTASKALSRTWDTASATAQVYGRGSSLYLKSLENVTAAKNDLDVALTNLRNALQPRFEAGMSATFESQWQAILKDAKAALRSAEVTYDEAKMNIFNPAGKLDELYTEVVSNRQSLENLQSMYEAGVDPTVTGYKISWGGTQLGAPEGPGPEGGFGKSGTMSEEFYKQQYDKMLESWRAPQQYEASPKAAATRVATATEELVEHEVSATSKLVLTPKVAEGLPEVEVGAPILAKPTSLTGLSALAAAAVTSAANTLVSAGSPALEEWASPMVTTTPEIIKATEEAAKVVTQISDVTTPEVVAITETALRAATKAATMGLTTPEISSATKDAIQNEVWSLTDSEVLTNTQAETLTQSVVQVATQIAEDVATKTGTKTITKTVTQLQTGPEEKKSKEILEEAPTVPDGTWAWKQGFGWRWFPPPYNALKPYFSFKPPVGAKHTNLRTPAETIQIIGNSTNVPDTVSIDLGIVDIFLFKKPKPRIEFKGKGLTTEVGERVPGPTTGLSVPAIDLHIPALTSLRLALGPFDFGLDSQPKERKEIKDSEPELRELTASLKDIGKL